MTRKLSVMLSTTAVFMIVFALFAPARAAAQSAQQQQAVDNVRARYTKYEYRIPVRDGVRLFTAVYVPKDTSQRYPFMFIRTPYSVGPYGVDNYRASLGPSEHFEREGFIFVYQDARGRYMSEGEFSQVRPHLPVKRRPSDIDESTDTYDTIEWLLKNVANHNGRVGMWGVSQPGFHVAASIIDSHPALKAASPQAPTADYYMGDDVYHNGAFMLAANFGFYANFLPQTEPAPPRQRVPFDPGTPDAYEFYLSLPPLAEVNQRLLKGEARYWQEIVDHTTYDDFWKRRSLWRFMDNVKAAVLNVGGWFDAEDPVGPFHIYHAVEKKNPGAVNLLVMGPWPHGGWSRGEGSRLGNVSFALKSAEVFREQIQFPFFMHHLKDKPAPLPEAFMFLTGINEWRGHASWPPQNLKPLKLYLSAGGRLTQEAPSAARADAFDEYVSDPNRPVPYLGYIIGGFEDYMTEDQRFASQRPDVLTYVTEPLEEDLIVAGPVKVALNVSTTGTDADFVVKLVDVYPATYPQPAAPQGQPLPPNFVRMGGYQQLVRGEPFRGKYRNSFERPEPFAPGTPAAINFELPDVYHSFRRGHRLMVQVQSSWFPLVDRNPQKFMEIPKAARADFQKATHRVHRARGLDSSVTLMIEGAAARLPEQKVGGRR
ncbi:MAG TPA: CocE/NonD family hydrolase [Pyrinomonadaceae bacterium]|nr:CocE/NonD family hydrolase [Pyrinomonadaceae bacterium]